MIHRGAVAVGNHSAPVPVLDHPRDLASRGTAGTSPLTELSAEFVRTKRAAGCSARTIQVYKFWLVRLRAQVGDDVSALDAAALTRLLADLRERNLSASTVHQAYRTLKTFTGWLVGVDALTHNPMAGLRVKTPATLPPVPTSEEVRAVLGSCPYTLQGRRNYSAILVMADAGVRSEELRRLRIEHVDPRTGSVSVRGKGMKDRVVFILPSTREAIRDYLLLRPGYCGSDYLFADAQGKPLQARHLVQILHRLSAKAGLQKNRRLHPHALRRFAATSWIRTGIGPEQVRLLLGHSSMATTLKYLSLVSADLQQAHREAAAIERLGVLPDRRFRTRSGRPLTPAWNGWLG